MLAVLSLTHGIERTPNIPHDCYFLERDPDAPYPLLVYVRRWLVPRDANRRGRQVGRHLDGVQPACRKPIWGHDKLRPTAFETHADAGCRAYWRGTYRARTIQINAYICRKDSTRFGLTSLADHADLHRRRQTFTSVLYPDLFQAGMVGQQIGFGFPAVLPQVQDT